MDREARRIELNGVLEAILGSDDVYYQPPESVSMNYPAIIYERDRIKTGKADNIAYMAHTMYRITLVDYEPDSAVIDKLLKLPYCNHIGHNVVDNLNHDIFTIYY